MDGMDIGESRKRPLDSDADQSMIKRSNYGHANDVLLKQLIPSHLAGVILGKGGETIISLQSSTGATIKMSKGSDYYPGTTDRICLITGSVESVVKAHNAVWQKIHDRINTSNKPVSEELKMKIVVPNATVGMIIGKGGCYVKQIKDDSGAFVQISQKSPDTMLVERVVTIAGTTEQISHAFDMVFKMIVDDPQSGSCPNISYADFKGPIANANPTGSPFASAVAVQPMDMGFTGGGFGYPGAASNALPSVTNSYGAANVPALETLKMTLRNSGFSVQASDEITAAMCTLANYGLLGTGLALGGFGFANGPGQCGLTLDYLSGILSGRPMGPQKPTDKFPCGSGGSQYPNVANGQEMFSSSYGSYGNMMNQNSFGLGSAAQQQTGAEGDTTGGGTTTKDIQIGENIVGAVLGHGGRAIVEIQRMTSATIQISKKGVFAPGTRNRIATISGAPAAVERAVYLVQQCIQQEEMKRSRQEQMLK